MVISVSLWAVASQAVPERFQAVYRVEYGGVTVGKTFWNLSPVGDDRYLFESLSTASGFWSFLFSGERLERSLWTWNGDRIRPLEYRYQRTDRAGREVLIHFNWEQNTALNTQKGRTWALDVEPGTLDKLVYLLALMQDLQQGRSEVEYTIADGGRLKTYKILNLGSERLQTPMGELDTVKLRRHVTSGKRRTTVWCAPNLSYLPVKVEHVEKNGDTGVMLIESVKGL